MKRFFPAAAQTNDVILAPKLINPKADNSSGSQREQRTSPLAVGFKEEEIGSKEEPMPGDKVVVIVDLNRIPLLLPYYCLTT